MIAMNKQLQRQAKNALYDIQIELAFALDNNDWSLVESSLKKVRAFIKEDQRRQ